MSHRTANRIRFFAGIGIAASGAAVLAGNLVGLIAALVLKSIVWRSQS